MVGGKQRSVTEPWSPAWRDSGAQCQKKVTEPRSPAGLRSGPSSAVGCAAAPAGDQAPPSAIAAWLEGAAPCWATCFLSRLRILHPRGTCVRSWGLLISSTADIWGWKTLVKRGCPVCGRTFAASLRQPTRWQPKMSPGIAKIPWELHYPPPQLRTTELNTKHQTYPGCLRLGQGLGLQHLYQKAGAYNCPRRSI